MGRQRRSRAIAAVSTSGPRPEAHLADDHNGFLSQVGHSFQPRGDARPHLHQIRRTLSGVVSLGAWAVCYSSFGVSQDAAAVCHAGGGLPSQSDRVSWLCLREAEDGRASPLRRARSDTSAASAPDRTQLSCDPEAAPGSPLSSACAG